MTLKFQISLVLCALLLPASVNGEEVVYYDDGAITGLPGEEPFVLDARSWPNPGSLDYSFVNFTPDMPALEVETAMAIAFASWAGACPNLAFSKVGDNLAPFADPTATPPSPPGAGDIRIQFGAGAHGDGFAFDGPGGVLAHAFFPPPTLGTGSGDSHFDEDETWALAGAAGGGQPRDLPTVATHEFGHALGLRHEPVIDAIMNPVYNGPRGLSADDIAGIRAKYCPAAVPSTIPIDLVYLIDITGSMGDDLPNIQAAIGVMLTAITASFTNVRLGLATHQDFPIAPYGSAGDVPWALDDPLGTPSAVIEASVGALVASGGNDFPESQYHAIKETLDNMNFIAGRLPVIILMTDADFHDSDVEVGYPGPGRIATLATIAAESAVVFTMISQNPPDLDGIDQNGYALAGGGDLEYLEVEAQELADLTGGAVFFVGTSSSLASQAMIGIAATLSVNAEQPVPALSPLGLLSLGTVLLGAAFFVIRRRVGATS
jgi:hypothetical protein